jgi:predicted aspartyl protease
MGGIRSVGALILMAVAAAGVTGSLKQFYDTRQWFDLRNAIGSDEARALYAGAIAAAFNNDERARKYLNEAIRSNASATTVKGAREILAHLYAREGLYKETVDQLDGILRIEPNRDTENSRALFALWSSHPDQSISSAKPSTIHADVRRNGVKLPVMVHGKTFHWLLDTGANFSFISEAEARALGFTIDEKAVNIADPAGGTARVRTAVADELAIGDVHIRNAGFLVLPDTQEPMSDWPPGERGVIGLPLVIALQFIDWRSDGRFQIRGPHGPTNGKQNLCFDGFHLVTRAKFHEQDSGGTDLDFVLDTGNQANTQLWRRFGDEFADLLKKHGMPSRERITTVGGSNVRETVMLPELLLQVGGLETRLRPASIYAKPTGDETHHGLLGMDVLSQAREVRIDLSRMRLDLFP